MIGVFICESWPSVAAEDADVTFRSADGVLFKIHSTNLRVCSEGFAQDLPFKNDSVCDLTEDSQTLNLLFQYIYPCTPPVLDNLGTDVVSPLADAAEKYIVYPAQRDCLHYMR